MEVVAQFEYLGRPLDQTYYDWLEVRQNVDWAQRVWGGLGKIIIRKCAEPKVVEMIYRAVTQAVLLFRSYNWFLSEGMESVVEWIHIGFLIDITGQQAWRKVDKTWVTPKAELVQSRRNPVGNDLHRKKIGDCRRVDGAAANNRGMCKG